MNDQPSAKNSAANDGPSMNAAKVQLSSAEMALLADPGWILTKNSIMGKAVELLAELSERYREEGPALREAVERAMGDGAQASEGHGEGAGMREEAQAVEGGGERAKKQRGEDTGTRGEDTVWRALLDHGLAGPKISRGENYKGLPYVILDYPRVFGKEDVFAIRTMLWWGHYFSVTLHLKGRYKALFLPVIRERLGLLAEHGFHIGESEEEWRHEVDAGGQGEDADGHDIEGLLTGRAFLKLSAKCGLDRWNEAGAVLQELFRVLVGVLVAQAVK